VKFYAFFEEKIFWPLRIAPLVSEWMTPGSGLSGLEDYRCSLKNWIMRAQDCLAEAS